MLKVKTIEIINKSTIGSVASFDDFSEIISELYQEWKHKSKIWSSTLQSLIVKLKTKIESEDPAGGSNELSIPDAILNNTQEPIDLTPLSNKRKPKRKQPLKKSNLKDIL